MRLNLPSGKNPAKNRVWKRAVFGLACIVVFCTTYALILPAITLESDTVVLDCNYTAHEHTEDCYNEDGEIVCGYADFAVHTHTEDCYGDDGELVCPLPDIEAHEHTEDCYVEVRTLICQEEEDLGHEHTDECYTYTRGELICEEEESEGHTHTEDCYGEGGELICELEESEGHTHTDECYEWTAELTCEEEGREAGHVHTDECYESELVLDCGKDEVIIHTHDWTCYDEDGELICGLLEVTEHVHGDDCFVTPDDGIAGMSLDEDGEIKTEEVEEFYLFLWAYEDGAYKNFYSQPEWSAELQRFDGDGISDALKYTADGETYYLIPIDWFEEKYKDYGFTFDSSDPGKCPFEYDPDASQAGDEFIPAIYVQVEEGEWYVRVQDKGNYNPPRSNIYYTAPAQVVTDTVSPSGTVINLFDYWTTKKIEKDVNENHYDSGINYEHSLKFKATGLSDANYWTGSETVYSGIVANTLGEDGYPYLSGQEIFGLDGGAVVSSSESLAYLFDPTVSVTVGGESYKDSYRNVTGLLQVDDGGYYYYDSTKNYSEFNGDANGFTLYDDWALTYTSKNQNTIRGQFFPFDPYDTVGKNIDAGTDNLNHFFGMTLTTRFVQQYDGYTNSTRNTPTTFEFSGDDDVWIFIDDVLVADLGGIHDPASVTINFATGDVVINEGKNSETKTTLYDAFYNAGKQDTVEWSVDENKGEHSDIFANNTYHTLKFYYLERGSFASNLSLRYNLSSYPPTSINKVNQYGDVVAGAEFSVYKATVEDGEWTYDKNNNPVYTGVTDDEGKMVFVDEDNMPYTMAELKKMFGEYFVIKETQAPAGYRLVSEEIKLHITNGVMLCENTYESGVWADATLQVSAPNTVKLFNYDDPKDVVDNNLNESGKIFAVVLKYIGPLNDEGMVTEDDLNKEENWAPVYGTSLEGFTIVDVDKEYGGNFIQAVIETAKLYKESDNVFSMSPGNGELMGNLNGMPGDLTTYYYMLPDSEKGKTKYTVAYYWTAADSLEQASTGNTYRIDADAEGYTFDRAFGSTINVPNLLNRLFVQKLDEDGNLVNGASFAMYKVYEKDGSIYYVANDNTRICLEKDVDADNEGEAWIEGNENTKGNYKINSDTGVITVTVGNDSYTISPQRYGGEGNKTVVTTADATKDTGEDGTAYFSNMLTGCYYVREIAAPNGYNLNTTEVMVLVTDDAVYANAGNSVDGITVARGPGYVVSTLDQFASQGQIDNTLTWVYSMLKINKSNTFTGFENALDKNDLHYATDRLGATSDIQNSAMRTYLKYDAGSGDALFNYVFDDEAAKFSMKSNDSVYSDKIYERTRRLYTDVGWSYIEIFQNTLYGLDQTMDSSVNYTVLHPTDDYGNLTGDNIDISNLFSRSTYIQVTDTSKDLTIIKVNESETALSGAEFVFYRGGEGTKEYYSYNENTETRSWNSLENGETKDNYVLTTDEEGMITLHNIPDGTYYLEEVTAPAGYNRLTETITVTVKDGVISNTYYADTGIQVDANDSRTLRVTNSAGHVLPSTGGTGTLMYTFSGIALMAGALVYYASIKRRRVKRN